MIEFISSVHSGKGEPFPLLTLERFHGMEEVIGSNPICSTIEIIVRKQ